MGAQFSFGKIQFDLSPGAAAARAPRDSETPFSLAVLGDFSGRSNRGLIEPIAARRPLHIDCDNFENVLAKFGATLRLPSPSQADETINLRIEKVDDFHPDQLLRNVGPLASLLEARRELLNPATASSALARLQARFSPPAGEAKPNAPQPPTESTEATLARLLGERPATPPASKSAATGIDLNALIRNIVAPSVVPSASAEQSVYLAAVEAESARILRAILRNAAFQNLEATWRGLDRLVRDFGAEENLKLHVIDISKEELAADLQAQEELALTGAFKLLRNHPWAVLAGHYTFSERVEDIELLGRLAKVSALVGAPFIAAASPGFVGCDSFGQHHDPDDWKRPMPDESRAAWRSLRELPEAPYLGLVLPRFLLRQPYGKSSDPIETFPLEELSDGSPHEAYLWGNPALVCGRLLAEAFGAEGWEMSADGSGEIGELPVHKFKQEGETQVKPCAEAWLSDRAAEVILKQGIMPLLSIKGRDAARLVRLQSISSPPKSLSLRCR